MFAEKNVLHFKMQFFPKFGHIFFKKTNPPPQDISMKPTLQILYFNT